nr:MAG TPA: hypothetical protein [Microviridae sp.]
MLPFVGYGFILKINICARAIYVRAHLFYIYVRVSVEGNDNPAAITQSVRYTIP